MTTHCPRCNMLLAQGAQVCPNCHLNLHQFMMQQQYQGPMFGAPIQPMSSGKENVYRRLLIIIVIVLMSEFVVTQLPWMFGFYSLITITTWLDALIWAAVPLTVALVLPKNTNGRVVLIVFASIYILLRLGYAYYIQNSWYSSFLYDLF